MKPVIDFLSFLLSLAPEGETPLIVRQKPQLLDGKFQYHADGALKCTWPAALPDYKRIKSGQAWYGNTASFIIDRLEDGHPSASAANCEYCLVLVLDDIGTKSQTPPLEPTWKMETSPGSFQWGYAFTEDQPKKAEFAAAVRAIATAGYTDPGAINPVRNFRLPGSVNLKPGRGEFPARLTEFHPERLFTLASICAALNVTPGEADGNGFAPIRILDTGDDDVFAWLNEQGLVLSAPNPEGWAGVVCPNSEQHTDGNPEGRYKPATRTFCCLHSHCLGVDSKTFLHWVANNNGPKHESGIRDDLIAAAMQDTLQKLEPGDFFSDSATKIIDEIEQRELGRIERDSWHDRFAYVMTDNAFFDLRDRREISRPAFDALFRHISCRSTHTGRRTEASTYFDEQRQPKGARTLTSVTYAAGEPVMVSRDGEFFGNRWRDARPQPKEGETWDGDVSMWLKHCEMLVPERAEREHIYNIMAFKLQHPSVKINHAVVHGGGEGCGKDTMWAPFIWSVCGPGLKNRGLLDNDNLHSQWGYQLESEILIINELKEPEARERRQLANKLKPIIAAPPELLSVNRKGLHPYDMVNRMFVLAFTNDPLPISIDSQDRRWFCVWSSAPRMVETEAKALWNWYKSGGFEAIAGWLHRRDVSAFNPAATPIGSEFKLNLIEHGISTAESYLVFMMRERRGEFASGVVGSPFYALCDRLTASAPSGVKIPQAALLHAFREAGWADMGRIASLHLSTKKHIYCAPDMADKPKSELRRLVEDQTTPKLKSVK